jgi:long-subunit fatty acid transport protein
MKKSNYILLFTLFLTFTLVQAQEEKESKFNIIVYGGIGYGIVENDNEPNYNLNSNTLEILVNYNINKKFGIATGIGLNELSGNGFNSIGNFYHERTLLKIPLLFTTSSNVTENLRLFANFGFFGQNIINDEYRFLNETQKDVYNGWNFGAQFGFGFAFEMFDNYSIGINYNAQSDLSKFESNNNAGINDKQKFTNLNSVGILFMIDL